MRTFFIIFTIYFVPALALFTFAWAMDKYFDKQFQNAMRKTQERDNRRLTNR